MVDGTSSSYEGISSSGGSAMLHGTERQYDLEKLEPPASHGDRRKEGGSGERQALPDD